MTEYQIKIFVIIINRLHHQLSHDLEGARNLKFYVCACYLTQGMIE